MEGPAVAHNEETMAYVWYDHRQTTE